VRWVGVGESCSKIDEYLGFCAAPPHRRPPTPHGRPKVACWFPLLECLVRAFFFSSKRVYKQACSTYSPFHDSPPSPLSSQGGQPTAIVSR
jgi:hypothetical protein